MPTFVKLGCVALDVLQAVNYLGSSCSDACITAAVSVSGAPLCGARLLVRHAAYVPSGCMKACWPAETTLSAVLRTMSPIAEGQLIYFQYNQA